MELLDIISDIIYSLKKISAKKLRWIIISRKSELLLHYCFISMCSGPFPALTTLTKYLPD